MKKEEKNFIQEFRTFISRGNVMDMAVGVSSSTLLRFGR